MDPTTFCLLRIRYLPGTRKRASGSTRGRGEESGGSGERQGPRVSLLQICQGVSQFFSETESPCGHRGRFFEKALAGLGTRANRDSGAGKSSPVGMCKFRLKMCSPALLVIPLLSHRSRGVQNRFLCGFQEDRPGLWRSKTCPFIKSAGDPELATSGTGLEGAVWDRNLGRATRTGGKGSLEESPPDGDRKARFGPVRQSFDRGLVEVPKERTRVAHFRPESGGKPGAFSTGIYRMREFPPSERPGSFSWAYAP